VFDRNVAGVVLTTPNGRIVNCNEACSRIFGFHSREEMLSHTAWDFYFNKAERTAIMERLRRQPDCPAEEVCLRSGNGEPVWVLATRTVAGFGKRGPTLFQGTLIDITEQKKFQASLRDSRNAGTLGTAPKTQSARMDELSQKLAVLLGNVSRTLQPSNLSTIDRAGIEECVLALEQMKMVMSELEIVHLLGE
jgi:PAS domain S-box-containing protein